MKRLQSTALVALVALAACGGPTKPPPRPPGPPPAPAQARAPEEAKAEPPPAEWTYTSAGKRDPFRSFLEEYESSGRSAASRCTSPLGKFEVEQLKLVAVITGLDDPVGMVEAPNGIGYALRRGACIGRNGGVVAAVLSGEVVISEWAIRADGTRDKTQTVLRLPKQASLNIEE